jgi:hypothetical protein
MPWKECSVMDERLPCPPPKQLQGLLEASKRGEVLRCVVAGCIHLST